MHSLDQLKGLQTELIDSSMELYEQTSRKGSRHSQPVGGQPPKYAELVAHVDQLIGLNYFTSFAAIFRANISIFATSARLIGALGRMVPNDVPEASASPLRMPSFVAVRMAE